MTIETYIGIIIGIISGTIAILLLRTVVKVSIKKIPTILTLITELLAIPAFMWGGHKIPMQNFDLGNYAESLTITFFVIIIYPLFRLIIKSGEEIGRGARG